MSCQGPDADLVSEVDSEGLLCLVALEAMHTGHFTFWHFGGRLWNSINVERSSSFNGDMPESMVVIEKFSAILSESCRCRFTRSGWTVMGPD